MKKQGLAVPNSDSLNPSKSFIPENYNNQMELKKY